MFIDNDDFVDPDYIQTFYDKITKSKSDIVVGGFRRVSSDTTLFVRKLASQKDFSKYTLVVPWAKIYRKSFIEKNRAEFLDTPVGEDTAFIVCLIAKYPKILITDYVGYNWFYNNSSVSNTAHKGLQKDVGIIKLLNAINYRTFKSEKDQQLNDYFLIRTIIWWLLYSGKDATPKMFISEYNAYFGWLDNNIPNYAHNNCIKPIGPRGEDVKNGFTVWAFMMMRKLHAIKLFAKIYCNGKNTQASYE